METFLNLLEKLGIIKSWETAAYDPAKVLYVKSKLKIDRKSNLVALFTRDAIFVIRT